MKSDGFDTDILIGQIQVLSDRLKRMGAWVDWEKTLKLYDSIIKQYLNKQVFPKLFQAPLTAQLELTYRCNLKCLQCYNRSGKSRIDELSDEAWLKAVKELVDLDIFECVISGGEPFLRTDLVFNIMDMMSEKNIVFLLISNGWFITEEIVKKLQKYKYHFIQISIDGHTSILHDSIRGIKGSWEKAVKAARLISDYGLPLCIAHNILPHNYKHIEEMIDLAYFLGAGHIIADEVIYTGAAVKNAEKLKLPKGWRKEFIKILKKKQAEFANTMNVLTASDPAISLRYSILEPNKAVLIRPNGDIKIDCIVPFVFGNVLHNSISDTWGNGLNNGWRHPQVVKFIEKIKQNTDLLKLSDFPIPHFHRDMYV